MLIQAIIRVPPGVETYPRSRALKAMSITSPRRVKPTALTPKITG